MLFANITEIADFHSEFVQTLDGGDPLTAARVGQAFVDTYDADVDRSKFMIYEHYYINHSKSCKYLQEKRDNDSFGSLLIGCQMVLGHQLPLKDYLLKPVQRLLKYPMLIAEMLKATVSSLSI